MAYSPAARVLCCPDLLPQILVRVGPTRDMVRCVAVAPSWLDAISSSGFAGEYAENHEASILGFLTEFDSLFGPLFELIGAEAPPGDDTVRCLRARINTFELAQDTVVASRGGMLLTKTRGFPLGYYTSCPFDNPRDFVFVGNNIPHLPHNMNQFPLNTLGQFGFIPNAGPGGMAFFDLDAPTPFMRTNDGITFNLSTMFHVHFSVYSNNSWHRFVSQPIPPTSTPVFFHNNPYCVVVRENIFMMYVVGLVVVFNTTTTIFSVIPLPGILSSGMVSDKSYVVSENREGGVFLAHWHLGSIYSWVLSINEDNIAWQIVGELDLMDIFLNCFGDGYWDRFFCDGTVPDGFHDYHGVQLRSATCDGGFILFTVGYDHGLFVLDCKKKVIRQIEAAYDDGEVASVFVLTELWPPRITTARI